MLGIGRGEGSGGMGGKVRRGIGPMEHHLELRAMDHRMDMMGKGCHSYSNMIGCHLIYSQGSCTRLKQVGFLSKSNLKAR